MVHAGKVFIMNKKRVYSITLFTNRDGNILTYFYRGRSFRAYITSRRQAQSLSKRAYNLQGLGYASIRPIISDCPGWAMDIHQ